MTKNRRHDIVKPSKFKTSLCAFFLSEEGCPFGDKCAFAHGDSELRNEPADATPGPEPAAVTSPTSSHASERGGNTSPESPTVRSAAKKKATKKVPLDASLPSSASAPVRGPASTKTRVPKERRVLLHQAPVPGLPLLPPAAFNLSMPPPPPGAFPVYGDVNLAYGGMPGMPYYIPAMGHHPFSMINNNQHAINVAPHMASSMPYTSLPPPPPPPQAQANPGHLSMPASPTALHHLGGQGLMPPQPPPPPQSAHAEDAKPRPRQPLRHVVSSNTMAYPHGRHTGAAGTSSQPEVASPQYLYGLMAAAAAPSVGTGLLGRNNTASRANTSAGAAVSSSPTQASSSSSYPLPPPPPALQAPAPSASPQPRLIVVPHTSGSGGFMVPDNIVNYHPPTSPNSGTAVLNNAFQQVRSSPARLPAMHAVRAGSTGDHLSSTSAGRDLSEGIWGPAGSTVNPLTITMPTSASSESGPADYNALLSNLGIGGSSYTTIPLEELVRPRTTTKDDDDASLAGDFDWTGALERWLHTAREEAATTAATNTAAAEPTPTPTVPAAAPTSSKAVTASPPSSSAAVATAAFLSQTRPPVASALNGTPVLMELEAKTKTAALTEPKRRAMGGICQVSRAGTSTITAATTTATAAAPRRRAPVMTNQFKSSCAAEADPGSVLLYCADKNTLVYIASTNGTNIGGGASAGSGASSVAAAAYTAATSAKYAESVSTSVKEDAETAAAAKEPDTPTTAGMSSDTIGLEVRFNPGRTKRSVLEPLPSDDDAEYCI